MKTKHKTQQTTSQNQTLNFMRRIMFGFIFLISFSSLAQNSNGGISINWDIEVGCPTYGNRNPGDPVLVSSIKPTDVINVCEKSIVQYVLTGGNVDPLTTTVWTVTGGTILSWDGANCQVEWGTAGPGSIKFSVTTSSGNVEDTVHFLKIQSPTAKFIVHPYTYRQRDYYACRGQILNFTNLSGPPTAIGQYTYQWDFGDNTFSTATNPIHSYSTPGDFDVVLTVSNACSCKDAYRIRVHVYENNKFEISCPTVVCEGQTATYSLPFNGNDVCGGNYNWSIYAGEPFVDLESNTTITPVSPNPLTVDQTNGNATVTWNAVDTTGFGYLTFYPFECEIDCIVATTIKVPVIQKTGTIIGNNKLCLGSQALFKLPQWPTTDFHWSVETSSGGSANITIINSDQRNEVILEPHQTGTFVLKAIYNNTLLHCGGTASFTFSVTSSPQVEGPSVVCQNSGAVYFQTVNNEPTNWYLYGPGGNLIKTTTNTSSFHFGALGAGVYNLVTGATNACASNTRSLTVVANPTAPAVYTDFFDPATSTSTPALANSFEICPNTPYTYYIDNPNPLFSYQWEVINGSIIGGGGSFSLGTEMNISFTGIGAPQIKLTVTTRNSGCSEIFFTNIPIKQIPVKINNGTLESTCANVYQNYQANYLSSTPTNPILYIEGDTYTWSLADNTLGSITDGQGTNTIKVLWNNQTGGVIHTFLYLVINQCTITTPLPPSSSAIRIPIDITPTPTISVSASPSPVCSGSPITFTVTTSDSSPITSGIVTWNFGPGATNISETNNIANCTYNNILNPIDSHLVTVHYTDINGCTGVTNTASVTVNVKQGPPATASLLNSANTFCQENEINATLVVSSSTVDTTFQWFYVPVSNQNSIITLTNQTQTTLILTPPSMGFGYYYFEATNANAANGCKTKSNKIYIYNHCPVPPCEYPSLPTLTNSSNQDCVLDSNYNSYNQINLIGTATSGYTATGWNIFGPPNLNLSNYQGNSFIPTSAGVFHTYFLASYYNPSTQQTCTFTSQDQLVVVPYIPNLRYEKTCNSNNNFTITLEDTTNYYSLLDSSYYTFYYHTGTNPATPWTPITGNVVTLAGGTSYQIKIEVKGYYQNNATQMCQKIISISAASLATIPSQQITFGQPFCYDTAVQFNINNFQTNLNYLWTFEPPTSFNNFSTANTATNTLQTPKRVFPQSGIKEVTVTITNSSGCQLTVSTTTGAGLSTTVTIPPKCFNGTIVSSPSPAKVCKGNLVTLSYQPASPSECPPTTYNWMNGNNLVASGTSYSLDVASNGVYWVHLQGGPSNRCNFDTSNRITPNFIPLPQLDLQGPGAICLNDSFTINAITNVSSLSWQLEGPNGTIPLPSNNSSSLTYLPTVAGNYTLTVQATSSEGCVKTATFGVTVNTPPDTPVIKQTVVCQGDDPDLDLQYFHVVLQETTNQTGVYNWSNGQSGTSTVVTDGGPYTVTISNGGCSSFAQTDVIKNFADYAWVIPTGCMTVCDTYDPQGTILGPSVSLQDWNWLINTDISDHGVNSFPDELPVIKSGDYAFNYNPGNCRTSVGTLSYNVIDCKVCDLEFGVRTIDSHTDPYCYYTTTISLLSSVDITITLTDPSNHFIITPSTFTLSAGVLLIAPITIIPTGVVPAGDYAIFAIGSNNGKDICTRKKTIRLDGCDGQGETGKTNAKYGTASFTLAPNPAKEEVTITYTDVDKDSFITIYDLVGRNMGEYPITSSNAITLDTSSYPNGVYIVVLHSANGVLYQQKLIKE